MHTLCLGITECGKTCLATILSKQLRSRGKKVAVYDPMFNQKWDCDFKTDRIDALNEYLERERSVYVFIDESGEVFNEGNDTSNNWLATRSRHYGHSVMFMAQRAVQIPTTMRFQCQRLYLFTSSAKDGVIHSEEWNWNDLRDCNTLPKFSFMYCDRYSVRERMQIVDFATIERVKSNANTDRHSSNGHRDSDNRSRNRKMDREKRTKGQRT